MNRRAYLTMMSTGVVSLAGCATSADSRTTTSPSVSTSSECTTDKQRLSFDFEKDYNLAYDSISGFTLTAQPETVAIGDTLTIRLVNTTDKTLTTSNRRHYTIQKRVAGGWKHIFWAADELPYFSGLVSHKPDKGLMWSWSVTEDGLSTERYHVCDALTIGTYRFVFFGVGKLEQGDTTNGGEQNEHAIAVQFDVEET